MPDGVAASCFSPGSWPSLAWSTLIKASGSWWVECKDSMKLPPAGVRLLPARVRTAAAGACACACASRLSACARGRALTVCQVQEAPLDPDAVVPATRAATGGGGQACSCRWVWSLLRDVDQNRLTAHCSSLAGAAGKRASMPSTL